MPAFLGIVFFGLQVSNLAAWLVWTSIVGTEVIITTRGITRTWFDLRLAGAVILANIASGLLGYCLLAPLSLWMGALVGLSDAGANLLANTLYYLFYIVTFVSITIVEGYVLCIVLRPIHAKSLVWRWCLISNVITGVLLIATLFNYRLWR